MSADDIVKQLLEDEEDEFSPEEVVAGALTPGYAALNAEEREIYDIAPDAFKEAVETGGDCEWDISGYTPPENWWPAYDDDDETWRKYSYSADYEVRAGHVWVVLQEGDSDGNWDYSDSAQLGTKKYVALVKEFSYGNWQRRMRDYMVWVAEHGEDPLDEFTAPRGPARTDKWLLGFVEEGGRPKFVKARHILAEPPSPPPFTDMSLLPSVVREYAVLDDAGFIDMSWEEFEALGEVKAHRGYHLVVYEPDQPEPLTQEEIEAHYRHAAQEQLDRWTEPTDADEVPYWS